MGHAVPLSLLFFIGGNGCSSVHKIGSGEPRPMTKSYMPKELIYNNSGACISLNTAYRMNFTGKNRPIVTIFTL